MWGNVKECDEYEECEGMWRMCESVGDEGLARMDKHAQRRILLSYYPFNLLANLD
jgi:hypothetical protein